MGNFFKTGKIHRGLPLAELAKWKDKAVIKVVTGVRRCGKSFLLSDFRESLRQAGVKASRIQSYNFEDLAFDRLLDYRTLHDEIVSKLARRQMNYVFLDEVQLVRGFERTVDSLLARGNVDLYITGSNAWMLSGELATLLSGRYVEIRLLPLSFAEWAADAPGERDRRFAEYMGGTAFPYARQLADENQVDVYLQGIYNTVLLKDVATRNNIRDIGQLQRVAWFLMDNIGSLVSVKKIGDTMASDGQRLSARAVDNYLTALSEAYLVYPVERWDVKGRELLRTGAKYYAVDLGLRRMLLGNRQGDWGHQLENLVALELMRRGWKIYVGRAGEMEVDFVCHRNSETRYVQVAQSVMEEKTLARELASLRAVRDSYPKLLLTMDHLPRTSFDGIEWRNVVDWLCSEDVRPSELRKVFH